MAFIFVLYFLLMYSVFLKSPIVVAYPYPFFFTTVQCFLATGYAYLAHVVYTRSFSIGRVTKKNIFELLHIGIFLFGIPLSGFAYAMQYIDEVTVCFILASKPFLNVLLLFFLQGKLLTRKQFLGLCIGLAGLIPIIMTMKPVVKSVDPVYVWVGTAVFFAVTIVYTYGWILLKEFMYKEKQIAPQVLTGTVLFSAGMTAYILHLVMYKTFYPSVVDGIYFYKMQAVGSISALVYGLYIVLLQWYSTTFLSFATFLQPGLGLLYAYVVDGKPLTTISIISFLLLVFGLYLFYQDEL